MPSWEESVKTKRAKLQAAVDALGYEKVGKVEEGKKDVTGIAKEMLDKGELEVTESDIDTLLSKLSTQEWTSEKVTVRFSHFSHFRDDSET